MRDTMLLQSGQFRIRLQLMTVSDEGAIGPGKAALLEAIRVHGSISAAGEALSISYRRCWRLVDEMNRYWAVPLVETRRGGSNQGASLTSTGAAVLADYRALESRLGALIEASPEADRLYDGLTAIS